MLTKEIYEVIRSGVLLKLETNLSKDLFYHCVEHTVDVEMQAERIALNEKVNDPEDLILLKLACLYHDTGFLFAYSEHEAEGCNLAKNDLPGFNVSLEQIEKICGMIMATKIPQAPHTKLEEIICDADLDYLGRDDFFLIGNNLFSELKARGIVNSQFDWNLIQIKFFKEHHYFTDTTKKLRGEKKSEHLAMIEAMLENSGSVVS